MAESKVSEQQATGQGQTTGQGQSTSQGLQARRANLPREQVGLLTPFSFMRRFTEDIDRLLEGVVGHPLALTPEVPGRDITWAPSVEMFQRDSELVIRAELPGMKKDDVNIEINEDVVTIEGERRQEREENRGGVYQSERVYGRFYREIPLPDGVIPESARATFKDGVLEIAVQMPPSGTKQARRVEIEEAKSPAQANK